MVRVTRILVGLALVAGTATAQERLPLDEYRLANGLHVILSEDHSVPVVTIDLWYNVGSAHERMNRSGFAHLFEHMMFEGSENVADDEHPALIARAGGSMNGTTNEDRTAYFETLPANRLNLGLWLEADRMRSLAINGQSFETQRNAVQEERRMRIDNQPYAGALVEGLTMAFDSTSCFAYSHSVIGSMDDLNSARVEDVQEFFDLYYAPGNATLVVTGDFDNAEARRLIDQYYADIPAGNQPPPVACEAPIGTTALTRTWEDPLANLPLTLVAYRIPRHADADTRALQLLSSILGDGESSRLNLSMVRERKTALQAGVQMDSRARSGLFTVLAIANQGSTAEELAQQLQAEVARVLAGGVTEAELQKAKSSYQHNDVFGRQTSMQVAENIQHFAHFHDDLNEIYTDMDGYLDVTVEDIKRVAQRYLIAANSLTILVVPKKDTPVP